MPVYKDVPIVMGQIKNKQEGKDSDDEEEYNEKRDKNGKPFYGPSFEKYLNCDDPMDYALALQETLNPFPKICVWKKIVAFLGSLPVALQRNEWIPSDADNFIKKRNVRKNKKECTPHSFTVGTHDDEAGSSRPKCTRQHETVEEAMLPRIYHAFLLWGTRTRAAKSRYNTNLARLLPKQIYSPCIVDWGVLNYMGCAKEIEAMLEIKVYEIGGQEEIFSSEAWYYWLSISREEELHLSRSLASTIRSPILRVLQKIIMYGLCLRTTGYDKMQRNELWLMSMFEARHQNGYANVAWLIAKWFKQKGVRIQRDSMIRCGYLITKITKKMGLLTDDVLNSLSALTYCRALDAITLRELISSNRKIYMIRWVTWRFVRRTLERMARRQSYQLDRYAGVFEYMAGQHEIPLYGAYAPLGYDEEQQED
ncbi:hypothetical protein Tco_1414385 [Tanacetum coccineum]